MDSLDRGKESSLKEWKIGLRVILPRSIHYSGIGMHFFYLWLHVQPKVIYGFPFEHVASNLVLVLVLFHRHYRLGHMLVILWILKILLAKFSKSIR